MSLSFYKNDSNEIYISAPELDSFLTQLGVAPNSQTLGDVFTNNKTFKLNNNKYTIENIKFDWNYPSGLVYNLYDAVAVAKAANISDEKIAQALYNARLSDKNSVDVVIGLSAFATPASESAQNYISMYYPNAEARIETHLNKKGNGYTYKVVYTDPTTGATRYETLSGLDGNKALTPEELDKLLGTNSTVGAALLSAHSFNTQNIIEKDNAQGQIDSGKSILEALGYTLNDDGSATLTDNSIGTSAKSNHTLTDAQVKSLETALPSTEDLKAWDKGNKLDIYKTLFKNQDTTDPATIGKNATDALTLLQGLSDVITGNQLDTTQRNINNQRQALLKQIRNDPALYEAIVQQLRSDNVAGTIAGQRAANVQQIAAQADATYDEQAAELYKSLFTGETAAATSTRDSVFKDYVGSLNSVQQGSLNDLEAIVRKNTAAENSALSDFVNTYSTALDVDTSKYDNSVKLNQSITDGKASQIIHSIENTVRQQIANDDGMLTSLAEKLKLDKEYLQSALNGQADVTPALGEFINNVTNKVATGEATIVDPQLVGEAAQFANKHYDDFVNSDAFKYYLSNEGYNALTSKKDINTLLEKYGLTDILTQEGIKTLYEGYAKEANKQSDKIFNKAQRAYIAAVTAGDAKTTEQLTRLALTAGASKGNLYTASALANQFKQQFNSNDARQMATDFNNQLSADSSMLATAGKNAYDNYTAIKGDGSDEYGKGTLNAIQGILDTATQTNKSHYNTIGADHMAATQGTNGQLGLNTSNVGSVVTDNNRKTNVASAITGYNIDAAANKTANAYVKDTMATDALAQIAQGKTTIDNINNKKKTS